MWRNEEVKRITLAGIKMRHLVAKETEQARKRVNVSAKD